MTLTADEIGNEAKILAYRNGPDNNHKLYINTQFTILDRSLQTTCLVDTGADLNLISALYLKQLLRSSWTKAKSMMKPSNIRVSSFTNDNIPIKGMLDIETKFVEHESYRKLRFHVIREDINVSCPVIVGIKTMTEFGLEIRYKRKNGINLPSVNTFRNKQFIPVPSYYLSDEEYSRTISKKLTLRPGEARTAVFYVNETSPFQAETSVLLTADSNTPAHILVIGTKSTLSRCPTTKQLIAHALVINTDDKPFTGQISGHLEDSLYYQAHEIRRENVGKILQHRALLDLDVFDTNQFNYEGKILLSDTSTLCQDSPVSSVKVVCTKSEPTTHHINLIKPINFPVHQHVGMNATAVDNDVSDKRHALTEERHNIPLDSPPPPEEAAAYNDPKKAVNLGFQDLKDEDFAKEILEHKGYYIPEDEMRNAADVIADLELDDDVRPHVERIFEKYDNTVSLHSMHRGNLTKYLGRYKLELKPGAQLPQHKRIFYLAPSESQLMKSILEFMISNGTIEAASPRGDQLDKFACSSFLVPRADKNSIGRLVVDYSLLNKCLKQEPPAIPTLDHILSELRGSAFYTNLDLSQAFYSIELHPDSREYTRFSTQFGFFNFKCLPTGVHSSPSLLERVLNHVVHYEVVRDKDGNVVWENEAEHIAKLRYSPLKHIQIFFDDLLVHTPWMGSYEKSKQFHFEVLEQLVQRISLHEGRLNLVKSTFFKTRLTYLGWNVSRNHVSVDQRRVQKALDFKLPESPKGWKSFLGTCNSLRLVLGYDCLKHVTTLSSLTSTKNKDKPTPKQIEAFHALKQQLTKGPLFCSIVLPTAPKICFVDSSSSQDGSFAAVLCQITQPKEEQAYIPTYLNLADPTHRIILDHDMPCIPAPWYDGKETEKEYRSKVNIDYPPEHKYLEAPYFGLTQEEAPFTISRALRSLFAIHNCSSDFLQICRQVSAELRKGMTRQQILDFSFGGNKQMFMDYISDLQNGNIAYDKGLYFFEALAKVLQRPITIISDLPEHDKIKVFNHDRKRPMFYFLLLRNKYGVMARPGYLDKDQCYQISKHRGSLEVISYLSKTLPEAVRKCHILQLELYAILVALHHFKKYIGGSELLVIGDAKCLFYAYNDDVQETSTKMSRWSSRLLDSFPNLQLGFCKSAQNLCDFLSKKFDIRPPTTSLLKLPNYVDDEVNRLVDQRVFNMSEWKLFVQSHPELIKYIEDPALQQRARIAFISSMADADFQGQLPLMGHDEHILAITRSQPKKETYTSSSQNLKSVIEPIQLLADILSPENIQPRQREEYPDIFEATLTAPKSTHVVGSVEYSLQNGQLFRRSNGILKLMIPPSLRPALISYVHLRSGHAGFERMMLNLDTYYCPELRKHVQRFCRACLPCALVNVNTAAEALATYPTPSDPFVTAHLDYVEALPPVRGFQHLLICTDLLTGMVLLFPTKGKTSEEFLRTYLYSIQQMYRVENLVSDNAQQFTSKETVSTLQTLGIRTIHTSSLSPQSKGNIERQVRNFKEALQKMLSSCSDYSWLLIAPYFSIMYNSSRLPRHEQTPFEMLYGKDSRLARGIWPLVNNTPKPHPIIARSSDHITAEKDKVKKILEQAQKHLDKQKTARNERINKTRSRMDLQPGDIIFAKNHQVRPGTTLPLKTRYYPSLYTVIEPRKTTALVRREIDNFVTVLHKSEFKKFVPMDEEFHDLPQPVLDVIMKLHEYPGKISEKDLVKLLPYEDFVVPDQSQIFHEEYPDFQLQLSDSFPLEHADDIEPAPRTTADSTVPDPPAPDQPPSASELGPPDADSPAATSNDETSSDNLPTGGNSDSIAANEAAKKPPSPPSPKQKRKYTKKIHVPDKKYNLRKRN